MHEILIATQEVVTHRREMRRSTKAEKQRISRIETFRFLISEPKVKPFFAIGSIIHYAMKKGLYH